MQLRFVFVSSPCCCWWWRWMLAVFTLEIDGAETTRCCKYSATCELPNIIITRHCTLPSKAIAKLAKQKGNIPGWNGPMLHSAKCPAAVVSTVSGAIVHRHHSDRVAGKPLFACKIFLPSRSTLDISSWDCCLNNCLGGGDGRWEIITGPKCEMRVLLMLKAEHSEENCCCCGVGEQLPATAVLL